MPRKKRSKRAKHKALHGKLGNLNKKAKKESDALNHGVQWLIAYMGLVGLVLFVNFIRSFIVPSKLFITYPVLRLIDVVFMVVLFFALYGLAERQPWGWKLSLGWFLATVIYAFILFQLVQSANMAIFFPLLLVLLVFVVALHALCFWYLYMKKLYFFNPFVKGNFTPIDKLFMITSLLLLVMMITISLTVWRFG